MSQSLGSGSRKYVLFAAPALLVCAGLYVALAANPSGAEKTPDAGIRPPAVAGGFYPGESPMLVGAIKAYLDDAVAPRVGRPIALIVPHAGYKFSGQIAADAYRQAQDHEYDLVVILGTNHRAAGFSGVSIYPGPGYKTPLGVAEIDQRLARKLIAADPDFTYEPRVHAQEHSVEVQVPFIQVVFPKAKIVTAVVGSAEKSLCRRFGKVLADELDGKKALVVASTDLSHYPAYPDAVIADHATLTAMVGLDGDTLRASMGQQLRRGRPGLSTCACGAAPALAAMEAAKALGAKRGVAISYANSGDTALANRSRVVGYGAVAFTAGEEGFDVSALQKPEPPSEEKPFTAAEKKTLVAFARESIQRVLDTMTIPLARDLPPALHRKQGAFVTLKKNGKLRGCIGRRQGEEPLGQVVGSVAVQAAFSDRRFQPVRPEEMKEIEIEVSVLSPLKMVSGPEEIVIGRDGVYMFIQGRWAVYLPEVAVEQGWTREEMLSHLCQKAGLAPNAWRSGAELYTFETEVLHESEHG